VCGNEANDLVVDLKGEPHGSFVRCCCEEKVPPFLHIGGVALDHFDSARVDLTRANINCEGDVAVEAQASVRVPNLTRELIEPRAASEMLEHTLPELTQIETLLHTDHIDVMTTGKPGSDAIGFH
jgi:hypothetical protein